MAEAVPLATRVRRTSEPLARRMLAAFVERLPVYGRLPQEQLEGEILDILRYNLRVFFRFLEHGEQPDDRDLAAIKASAARRAEERIPLDAVLSAYHLGATIGWEALVENAGPDETEQLITAAGQVLAYTQATTMAVAEAYVEERQAIYGEERDARRALTYALLSGTATKAMADRAGHAPADGYAVLTLAIGPSPDEQDEGVQAAVAARRKVRRVEQHLLETAGAEALALLAPAGGTIVVPTAEEQWRDGSARADLARLVDGLAAAAGAEITAGVAWRPDDEAVREAGDEAGQVLELAVTLGRPPATYALDDLLLEYAVTRPSEVTARLAALLDPLADGPELIETLDAYFAADLDRRAAAASLNVHPNTLDYRLRRIAELTGLSLGTTRGLHLLGAALVAHRRLRD